MPKAHEIATELRKLADALDTTPEAEMVKGYASFSSRYSNKETFLNIAKVMPRPYKKSGGVTDDEIELIYESPALCVYANALRSNLCRLVKPAQAAQYECDPILSALEEAQLEASDDSI